MIGYGSIILIISIFALIDVLRTNTFKSETDKLLWIVIVLIAPLLGAIIWFTYGKNRLS
ncbi:PLDc N-terminal domain-containing protein [Penaeicola halotolerans]|uniref:PLDc N-terminal domain-containing protein n=1 Tax=Penaeicola halotolerans TaxID=2793196 RepID=UPI001CF8F2C7|nr:PLDc N-terminal domain-containing protein [Penaeicola halotolerans]